MQTRAGRGRQTSAKRSRPDRAARPVIKRQKLTEDWEESFCITLIDADGDLLVKAEGDEPIYKIDSNALRRASPELYEQCLAVRPSDGSDTNWQFEGMPATSDYSACMVLSLIHGDVDSIPESMGFRRVYDAVLFAIRCRMLDRYKSTLKQWYQAMAPSEMEKSRNCYRLWLAYKLDLEDEFLELQRWAIFNLCDNGIGALGDPDESFPLGEPLDLSRFELSDRTVMGEFIPVLRRYGCGADPTHTLERIIRLRLEAVGFIFTNLNDLQDSLISARDGPIGNGFDGSGCQGCRDRWFSCLSRGLVQPKQVWKILPPNFPCLFPMIEAGDFHPSLEELCAFIGGLQTKIEWYFPNWSYKTCSGQKQALGDDCNPPHLVGWVAVENLVMDGLRAPLDAN